ncbi:AbrB/MazE/SpoVT family DNA-binding domain-containing protein [Vreelandella massiliensis]|uniref:AbrB/MazE/SpoVT family DNA-binding domain-containing protein n=1 Tax=Vreelandella massiliensis TaxID=1816686 RepID=UPI00096AC261|nr:AbrB/MazE/SpoVT family DNA-binding domain-containing protein [Halomonas massiliensis]
MRTHLRKIGNSKGVLISASLLNELGIEDEVEIHSEGRRLVVEAVKRPRQGWFEGYNAAQDSDTWPDVMEDADNEEWQW